MPDIIALEDNKELLLRIAEGDEESFTQFFCSWSPQVLAWASSVLHHPEVEKEILQEVFIRIWLNREQLPEIEFLQAWVKKITLNRSFTFLQSQARRYAREAGVVPVSSDTDVIDELSGKELRAAVARAVQDLPEQRRRIFLMSREQGMSTSEIAEALNLSPGSVRNTISLALSSIRTHLEVSGRYVPLFLFFLK